MKKFESLKNKKTLILSAILLVAILGVSSTVALAVATTKGVINSFQAAKLDTEIEENVKPDLTKEVKITNMENAKSDAYVRVRFSCTPEEHVDLVLQDENGNSSVAESESDVQPWIKGSKDDFYYYRYALAPGESTSQLLSKVIPKGEYKGNMEVTVYQEACVASEKTHVGDEGAKPISLQTLEDAFKKAEGK